jgi:hypothetical protein
MTSLSVTSTMVVRLSKKRRMYWRSVSPYSCLTIARSMRVLEHPMEPKKLLVNWAFSSSHSSIEFFSSDSSHVSGAWSRQKGKKRHLASLLTTLFSMVRM